MHRPCPPEFRARAISLVRACKQAKQTAVELGLHPVTLSNWIRRDDIDYGRPPGVRISEYAELRTAKPRVRGLEAELLIVRHAALSSSRQGVGWPVVGYGRHEAVPPDIDALREADVERVGSEGV